MVEANIETTRKITLCLSEEEARWLRAIVQNPMDVTPAEESPIDSKMRRTFWDALEHIDII